jgi:hypothetical protein
MNTSWAEAILRQPRTIAAVSRSILLETVENSLPNRINEGLVVVVIKGAISPQIFVAAIKNVNSNSNGHP